MHGKYRNWCFTSYNRMYKSDFDSDDMRYICWQEEICPSTGKKHWQGYVEFINQKRFNEAKIAMKDSTIHIEPRKGTQAQAIEYCKKKDGSQVDDTFVEYGKKGEQGHRTDLDSIMEAIESGESAVNIFRNFKGNALRHVSQIMRVMRIFDGNDADARYRDLKIELNENASEVTGNTTDEASSSDLSLQLDKLGKDILSNFSLKRRT